MLDYQISKKNSKYSTKISKLTSAHFENYFVEKDDDIRNIIEKTCKNLNNFEKAIRTLFIMEENDLLDTKVKIGQGLNIPNNFPATSDILSMPKIKKFRLKMMDLLG